MPGKMHRKKKATQVDSMGPAAMTSDDDGLTAIQSKNSLWYMHPMMQWYLNIMAFLSLGSVCCNTPQTFKLAEKYGLIYITFVADILIFISFLVELVVKVTVLGLLRPPPQRKGEMAYLRDHWCRFELSMVIFLFLSIVMHIFQILPRFEINVIADEHFGWVGVIRSPRPLIVIRLFRVLLNVKLPTARISSILKRSSQQIYNVTLFFLFFMSFYGILGVQFFGDLRYRCVDKDANRSDITINDLAIPDTQCTPRNDSKHGYTCPPGLICIDMPQNLGSRILGYTTFEHFLISFFSVYNAASQEGWSNVMYNTIDTLASWKAYVYFISLIFLLAWLVKNVFIAVIIETFAEFRVQFQKMWGSHDTTPERSSMVFTHDEQQSWKLVNVDATKPTSLAPQSLQHWVRSPYFNVMFMVFVLADSGVAVGRSYSTDRLENEPLDAFYYAQIGFTVLFDIEVLLKIWCYGPRGYIRRSQHKFELALAFFSTLHIIPDCYRTVLTYAQVFRLFRLIRASPLLEEFCWKIFGPGKKLGSLVLFTMALLIITSGISLQLFCYIQVPRDDSSDVQYYQQFSTFTEALQSTFQMLTGENWSDIMYELMRLSSPFAAILIAVYFVIQNLFMTAAFMSMFQILLKKNWTDIMYKTLRLAGTIGEPFVAIYFVCFHLLVTVIILSLFVAVILDNLDLDEDLKRLKQLKAREISTEQQQNLPYRLRVFEKFSNQPQLVTVKKRVAPDFEAPSIRESFMRGFIEDEHENNINTGLRLKKSLLGVPQRNLGDISLLTGRPASKSSKDAFRKEEVSELINDSIKQRNINSSDPLMTKGNQTLPTQKSLLAGGTMGTSSGNNNKALRALMSRTIKPFEESARHIGARANIPTRRLITVESNPGAGSTKSAHPQGNATRTTQSDDIDIQILQQKKQQAEIKRSQQESDLRENHPLFDTPLFIVGRESKFREFCRRIVSARYNQSNADPIVGQEGQLKLKYKQLAKFLSIVPLLDWFMIFITVLSCFCMMMETPSHRVTDPENKLLVAAECIFVTSMSIEVALKIFAHGLFFTPNAVVRDVGGAMDMFIYYVSLLFLVTMVIIRPTHIAYLSYGHVLLILRSMRPLRIFILVPHIRKVVYEVVRGFKDIMLVTVLLIALMFVFASYGVQCYGGRLRRCNDVNITTKADCVGKFYREVRVTEMNLKIKEGEKAPGYYVPRVWTNPHNFNFDDISSAMLALFEVLSLEGWLEIRDILIYRVGQSESLYVHIFVFIGVLIGLTLFVGVVISNYSQNKGTALLTVDQRRWLDLKGRINLTPPLHLPPRPEGNWFREAMFDITQHRFFKRGVAVLVLLNSMLLVMPWNANVLDKVPGYTYYLQGAAVGFVFLFTIEVAMKLIALSPKGYWYSRRNRIDILVSFAGIVWSILHFALDEDSPWLKNTAKTSREGIDTMGYFVIIVRFCTITGKHATLKMLMQTIVVSMWKSFFLISGIILLMVCYAYGGVLMFGSVRYGENLNRRANFRTAGQAIILLFRIVTGEDWNKIMHDCMITQPYCFGGSNRNYWETDCGNAVLSVIYFCSFYIIITYIMLNLLVAIIMENFSLFYSNEENALLSYSDIRMYQNTWNMVDHARRGAIPNRRVPVLLRLLKGRLEIDHDALPTKFLFKHMCYEISYLHGGPAGEATFHDVLIMLSYRSVEIRKSLQLEELLAREDLELTIAEEVAKQLISNWLTKCVRRMKARGLNLARKTPEPFYVVTEAEETPLMEAQLLETTGSVSDDNEKGHRRNISEPQIGLKLPRKNTGTPADQAIRDRLKRNSITTRTTFSAGSSVASLKDKTSAVGNWWQEQFG